jgi:hypothetical protein
VLDRAIIIHFPRPTELKRRLKLTALDKSNRGQFLHRNSWESWVVRESSLTDEEVEPYKEFLKGINASLGVVGRAIGHRVWQSVEYYMANYPDVRAAQQGGDKDTLAKALHIAFEDQLVQKVMPKLRGIDTSGKSKTECLDKILAQINSGIGDKPFNLAEDFDLACELGHGQFIWQSANYLNENDASIVSHLSKSGSIAAGDGIAKHITSEPESSGDDTSDPPSWFRPDEPKRKEYWVKKSQKQKEQLIAEYKKRSE